MIKKISYITVALIVAASICSCTILQKPIDKKINFSDNLKLIESYIRSDDWENAKSSLKISENSWKKIKPLMQIDIDHDYINLIEENFVKLGGYIDTEDKSESLVTILMIRDTWDNIGSL